MTSLVSNNFAQIISVVSFPHQLIQEEQLSVAGESMCTSIGKPAQEKCVWVNWLVQHCLRAGLGGSVGCAVRLGGWLGGAKGCVSYITGASS